MVLMCCMKSVFPTVFPSLYAAQGASVIIHSSLVAQMGGGNVSLPKNNLKSTLFHCVSFGSFCLLPCSFEYVRGHLACYYYNFVMALHVKIDGHGLCFVVLISGGKGSGDPGAVAALH